MPEYKVQHYLPQSYLKGFSKIEKAPNGEEQETVWIYDIKKQKIKQKQPHNVAWKPYYYSIINEKGEMDHTLEKELAQIENDAKNLFIRINEDIEKIIINDTENLRKIMPVDKKLIINFIFLMLKRVPSSMQQLYAGISNLAIEMEQKYKEYNLKIPEAEIRRRTIEMFYQLGLSETYNIPSKFFSKNIKFGYIHNDKTSFITTDNPVVRWRKNGPAGIGYDDTEIYFPINQRCILVLYGIGNKINIARYSNRKQIYDLNKYIARFAQELLISRSKELLIKVIKDLKFSIK